MCEARRHYGILLRMKLLLTIGLLMWSTASLSGCSAFGQKMCEDQLADTRAQLARTAALANNLSAQLQKQQAEIEVVKQLNAENVRREKEKELARIEAQRQDLAGAIRNRPNEGTGRSSPRGPGHCWRPRHYQGRGNSRKLILVRERW
jgi:hypothetical protein